MTAPLPLQEVKLVPIQRVKWVNAILQYLQGLQASAGQMQSVKHYLLFTDAAVQLLMAICPPAVFQRDVHTYMVRSASLKLSLQM